jgi:hypothetical protein
MRLKCNFCEKYVTDRHVLPTDSLKLVTIGGRDYLVCEQHQGGANNGQPTIRRNSQRLSKTVKRV